MSQTAKSFLIYLEINQTDMAEGTRMHDTCEVAVYFPKLTPAVAPKLPPLKVCVKLHLFGVSCETVAVDAARLHSNERSRRLVLLVLPAHQVQHRGTWMKASARISAELSLTPTCPSFTLQLQLNNKALPSHHDCLSVNLFDARLKLLAPSSLLLHCPTAAGSFKVFACACSRAAWRACSFEFCFACLRLKGLRHSCTPSANRSMHSSSSSFSGSRRALWQSNLAAQTRSRP